MEEVIKNLYDQLLRTNGMLEDMNAELEETNAHLEEEIQEHQQGEIELIKAKEAESANAAISVLSLFWVWNNDSVRLNA